MALLVPVVLLAVCAALVGYGSVAARSTAAIRVAAGPVAEPSTPADPAGAQPAVAAAGSRISPRARAAAARRTRPVATPVAGRGLDDPAVRDRAAMITSTFENSTTTLRYGYAEDIGDGRGLTAGRAGFTTATGDLLLVVERYTARRPNTPLSEYLPALREAVDRDPEEVADRLEGLPAAWARAAEDSDFRSVQDSVVDELYLRPAVRLARSYGIRSALGQAVVWDTNIQHGVGGTDGTRAILRETAKAMNGPARGNEGAWLRTFLDRRLWHLLHWSERGYQQSASASRARVAAWRSLVNAGKFGLSAPLSWRAYGETCRIGADGAGAGRCGRG